MVCFDDLRLNLYWVIVSHVIVAWDSLNDEVSLVAGRVDSDQDKLQTGIVGNQICLLNSEYPDIQKLK